MTRRRAARGRTGLAAPDVFYFGSPVGDTGNSNARLRVDVIDAAYARLSGLDVAPSRFDFDRDGRVNAVDLGIVRANHYASLSPPAAANVAVASARLLKTASGSAATSLLRQPPAAKPDYAAPA